MVQEEQQPPPQPRTAMKRVAQMKKVQEEIDVERSSGKAVWETVGIGTVPYRDPFHTGLSKRTPTGATPPHPSRARRKIAVARLVRLARLQPRAPACFAELGCSSSCARQVASSRHKRAVPAGWRRRNKGPYISLYFPRFSLYSNTSLDFPYISLYFPRFPYIIFPYTFP